MFGHSRKEKMTAVEYEQLALELMVDGLASEPTLIKTEVPKLQPADYQEFYHNITPSEYQRIILKTFNLSNLDNLMDEAVLGLGGEIGEVLNEWRKERYQGHPRNLKHLVEELGDVLCYLMVAAKALDVSLEYLMFENIKKKLKRYPNGFDPIKSQKR